MQRQGLRGATHKQALKGRQGMASGKHRSAEGEGRARNSLGKRRGSGTPQEALKGGRGKEGLSQLIESTAQRVSSDREENFETRRGEQTFSTWKSRGSRKIHGEKGGRGDRLKRKGAANVDIRSDREVKKSLRQRTPLGTGFRDQELTKG